MRDVTIITSQSCLEYDSEGHPENSLRVARTLELLKSQSFRLVPAVSCTEQDILRVHTHEHLERVRTGRFHEADTPNLPGMYTHARLAAGAAIEAAELATHGHPTFSLMRPPGHHATRNRLMGFCYFNNIAIAVAHMLEPGSRPEAHAFSHDLAPQRIAILDVDCHHGNGTEDFVRHRRDLLYVSLHQHPCYPGTGAQSDDNCLNFPLLPGTGEEEYLETLENGIASIAEFKPDLLAVSAGFDTYKEDPITQMGLDVGSFQQIGQRISQLHVPTFSVLEGGYSTRLPECVLAYLDGLKS